MELQQITFQGPPIDDWGILDQVPSELAKLLGEINGFVQFHGGLHVRGACLSSEWHSLRDAWHGPDALHRGYQSMRAADIPFAEDCVGDQFFLRDDVVWKLMAETDEADSMGVSFWEFLHAAQQDPVEYLGMHPLLQYMREHGHGLEPNTLLSVYPPFCTAESANGVNIRSIPAGERRGFLMEIASAIRQLPQGAKLTFKVTD